MKIKVLWQAAVILICALQAGPVTAKKWQVPGDALTIQAGIDSATAGDTVLVLCGTYYEHDIKMKSGVCLLSETGEAGCVTIDAQKKGRVIYCRFAESRARIEGFTITGGSASEGGGLYCLDVSSPSVENCVITGNSASGCGGGVYCYVNSSPEFVNCTIEGNSGGSGGGMGCQYNSSPALTDCRLLDNSTTSSGGGGIYCFLYCKPALERCTFSGNWAFSCGGGMDCSFGCLVTLNDCTFSGNRGDWRGGGLNCWDCTAVLSGCTFSNNTGQSGGGVTFAPGTYATFTDCSFNGNSVNTKGGGLKFLDASALLKYCTLNGNSAQDGGGVYLEGTSSLSADSTEFHNNTALDEGPHGYVESGSELTLNCSVSDLGGFVGDGVITMNNEGCGTSTERISWGRIKTFYIKK